MIYKRKKHWHMDVTTNGVRYREALDTTDRREALALENQRIHQIHEGKGVSAIGRQLSRKPFSAAADQYLDERKPHTADRTQQLERNLLSPLRRFFGEKALFKVTADDISEYQRARRVTGISGRTLNMEVGTLRRLMKRAKVWSIVTEDVKLDREGARPIGKVLSPEHKRLLFETAASRDDWSVAYCAAVLAVSTTCRGIELKNLRWKDVDLFGREIAIQRSKTAAGLRTIPLNADAMAAIAKLLKRAEAMGSSAEDHFVFPACENHTVDPTRPQKTWRTAWRSLVEETARRAEEQAVTAAAELGCRPNRGGEAGQNGFRQLPR